MSDDTLDMTVLRQVVRDRLASQQASDVSLMPEKVHAAMADSGILPGDPLYPVVKSLADTMQTVADGSQALVASVQAAAAEEVGKAAARVAEVECAALERLAAAMEKAAASGAVRLQWKAAGMVALGMVLSLGVGGGIGWWAGRSATHVVEGELSAAFQDGPDAARIWLELWRANDPVKAMERCSGTAGFEQAGRRGCWVPLWLEPAPAPKSTWGNK